MNVISRGEVEALEIPARDFIAALEEGFLAVREGRIVGRPKYTINQPDGAFLIGALGCWPERGLGIFHNIMGVSPERVPHGVPHFTTMQLLADYATGTPLALIDGSFTSTMLPAYVTALAAKRLARRDSRIAAFVAAGLQARVNLEALRDCLPIAEVRVISRTAASAERFAELARRQGLRATVESDAERAIRGADVVVSSVPSSPGLRPALDPRWVAPGAFVSAVDIGRSWMPGLEAFDKVGTDDRAQAAVQHADGRFPYGGRLDFELPDLVAGACPGRERAEERIALIHPGNIVGVLAMSALIHRRWTESRAA